MTFNAWKYINDDTSSLLEFVSALEQHGARVTKIELMADTETKASREFSLFSIPFEIKPYPGIHVGEYIL